jgi:hypothetical protein
VFEVLHTATDPSPYVVFFMWPIERGVFPERTITPHAVPVSFAVNPTVTADAVVLATTTLATAGVL